MYPSLPRPDRRIMQHVDRLLMALITSPLADPATKRIALALLDEDEASIDDHRAELGNDSDTSRN